MSKRSELRELIDLIKFSTGKTQAEIADEIGYKRTYLSEAISKPKAPQKLITTIKLQYRGVLENEQKDTSLDGPTQAAEPDHKYAKRSAPAKKDLSIIAISNLSESNRLMAESQLSLAKSHEELVMMLKSSIGSGSKETLEAVGAKLLALQEFVIEQSVTRHKFHSEEEARSTLGIKTSALLKKKG